MAEKLKDLLEALQKRLCASLGANRAAFDHPVSKGLATESDWVTMLSAHLPNRYQVDNAFVIDVNGNVSEQIDVVIYDRQYTPILYNHENQRVIPAESVYAVFEVKQEIDKKNIEYAGKKASSVRSLARTSTRIIHAGGEHEPRPPIPILAGILAYQSSWNPPFGAALKESLCERGKLERIDLGWAGILAWHLIFLFYNDPNTDLSREFFAVVQNKMHWAAHGQTAAEVIYGRAD